MDLGGVGRVLCVCVNECTPLVSECIVKMELLISAIIFRHHTPGYLFWWKK